MEARKRLIAMLQFARRRMLRYRDSVMGRVPIWSWAKIRMLRLGLFLKRGVKASFESKVWTSLKSVPERVYFTIRHFCFRILAVLNCRWLPFSRQAEKELKPYQEHIKPRRTPTEHLGLGLYRPLLIFLLPVAATLVLVFTFDFPLLAPGVADSSGLTGILKTTGTILATLTAILLAVTALAIQTTLANLPGASFLLGAFARRQGFIPVASLLLGTLVSIIVGVVVADLLTHQTLNDWVLITAFTAFVSALMLFDLLRRTFQGLGQTDVAELLQTELTNNWRLHTHAVFHQILSEIHFRTEFAKHGFARNVCSENRSPETAAYWLRRRGRIAVIDTAPLRRIASALHLAAVKPNLDLSYMGWLAGRGTDGPCVTIPEDGNITPEKSLALILPTSSQRTAKGDSSQINRLVQRAFVFGGSRATYFNWQTLYSLLMQAVEKRDSALTKAVLDTFQTLLEDHLSVFTKFMRQVETMGATPPGDFNMNYAYHFSPPHPWELKLSDLVIRASQNNSSDCLDEILNSIYRLVHMCFEKNDVRSFHDLLFQFYWSYRSSLASSDANSRLVAAPIMHRLPWMAQDLGSHLFEHEDSVEHLEKVRDFSMPYYSLCLHLLRCSSENGDEVMFARIFEVLDRFLEYRIPKERDIKLLRDGRNGDGTYRGIGAYGVHSQSPQDQDRFLSAWTDLHDYRNLIYVIVAAWLIRQIKDNKLDVEKASPFIERLIGKVPSFRSLLDLYAIPGMGGITAALGNPLGFYDWDQPYSPYPNPICGTEFQRWIEPFYRFLLLKEAAHESPTKIRLDGIRQTKEVNAEAIIYFLSKIAHMSFNLPPEFQSTPWALSTEDVIKAKTQLKRLLDLWSPPTAP